MVTFNYDDLLFYIYNLFFPVVRILSFVSIAPLLGDKVIGKKNKLIIAFVISFLFVSCLPRNNIIIFSTDGFLIFIEQVLIGISLGFIMQLMFSFIFLSGEIISLQMGLSFSSLFDSHLHSNISIISRFLYLFLFLFFLEIDGHLWMISILFDTFITMPIQKLNFNSNFFLKIVLYLKYILIDGFMLLLPLIVIQLVLNLSIGILNRLASQLSIFSIGFTITLLVGIIMLYVFIPVIPSVYIIILNDFKRHCLVNFKLF